MRRLIGYWKASLRDEYPFPQELRAEYSPETRDRLVAHLESGCISDGYCGSSWCRFGCPGRNGSAELTDGLWVWPEGLVHYMRHQPVLLPADFVRHATTAHPPATAPQRVQDFASILAGEIPLRRERADQSFWIAWARAYRLRSVDTLLAEARVSASRACEVMLNAAAVAREKKKGLGTGECITAGCTRRVIAEKALCARCLVERDRPSAQSDADHRELGRVFALLPGALSTVA